MAIDATPGGAAANSYISLAAAQAYFDNRLAVDAWNDSLEQEEALLQACLVLEQFDYVGEEVTSTQALKWPRQDLDGKSMIMGYPTNAVPPPIQYAQCETALWLLKSGGSGVAIGGTGAVESMQIGSSIKVTYAQPSSASGGLADLSGTDPQGLPLQAARFLKGLRIVNVLA